STHIEPNVDWGFEVFNEVAEVLYDLKGATKAAPPVPALDSYDADRNSLKIALDGFPLEYRISNDETLDGAQWEFLDLRDGGIKPKSDINRNEAIYLQTRNSFGESATGSITIPSGVLWDISFQVSDSDGVVEGAAVEFDGRLVNTGTDGMAQITDVLSGGSIAYSIAKDGYKTVSGSLDVSRDSTVAVTLIATGITPGDLWETVDDVNESVTYTGEWATGNWDGYHRNSCHYTSQKGAIASFTFTGRGIKLVGAVNTNLGKAEVYIDGVVQDTIDFYRDTMALQVVLFADSTLSAGEHTIEIIATGTKRPEATDPIIIIDAFKVKIMAYEISFQVSDGNGALEGASVMLGDSIKNTDVDGVALFANVLPANALNYAVTKSGYEPVTGSIDVYKDTTIAVTLNPTSIVPDDSWHIYDDTDVGISYEGEWLTGDWEGYYHNTCHYAYKEDAKASFTFTGTGIILIAPTNNNLGKAQVFIDGTLKETVDYYGEFALQQTIFIDSSLSSGEHTIEVVATNTMRPEAQGTFVFIDAFAVKEGPDHVSSRADESAVKLFPNPSSGSFWISNIQGDADIRIYSISGKLVHQERVEAGPISHTRDIDIADLGTGVYFVRVISENQHETIKLLIEN
ncbi:MAG: T9SS type A sorting domain-containing protein, partial [Bacteroidota bacterium]